MDRLEGKYALITGGTSGIGFETAREFLAEGAAVAITGRSRERLEEAARRLGGRVLPVLSVLSDAGDVPGQAALAARLRQEWPRLDVVMSNAADVTHLPIEEWTEEAFDRLIATNLKGAFNWCKAVAPTMLAQRSGRIVSISSVSAHTGAGTG